ncbi:MAG: DUF5615 family PIN-like protein [Anaerolineae bacterium]
MAGPIRFYTDEHVARAVVTALRRRGVGVLTVPEAGMRGATDVDHLQLALEQNVVIFTQDDDFLRHHAQGMPHNGIVYARQQTPIGDLIRGLMLIYHVLTPEDIQNHVEFL